MTGKKDDARGHFIKEWREYNELSQSELARKTGLSPSAFSLLERGKTQYTQKVLERVAETLNATPAMLISQNPFYPDQESEFLIRITELLREMQPISRLLVVEILEAVLRQEARQKKTGLASLGISSEASLT